MMAWLAAGTTAAGIVSVVLLLTGPSPQDVRVITISSAAIAVLMIYVSWDVLGRTPPDLSWGYLAVVSAVVHAMAAGGGINGLVSLRRGKEDE